MGFCCVFGYNNRSDQQKEGSSWISQEMEQLRTPTRTTSGFLPGFLLGEQEVSSLADSSRLSFAGNVTTSPKDVEMSSPTSPQSFSQLGPNYSRMTKPAVSGPPTLSLYDEMNSSILDTKENQPVERTDVLQQTRNEDTEGHWVLVFGFPPSATSHVLSFFSQIGTVLDSSFPTSGNWMFVKYATRSDARKALSYDSKVINGNIMIAVREGKNINQMRTAYPSTPTLHNSSIINAPAGSPSGVLSPKLRNLGGPRRSIPVQQVLDTSVTTPNSPSIVSKAMDIFFNGW